VKVAKNGEGFRGTPRAFKRGENMENSSPRALFLDRGPVRSMKKKGITREEGRCWEKKLFSSGAGGAINFIKKIILRGGQKRKKKESTIALGEQKKRVLLSGRSTKEFFYKEGISVSRMRRKKNGNQL